MTTFSQHTLTRWRRDPIAFIEEVLVDPETGRAFELYPEEKAFLRLAFTITPDGRLPYVELLFNAPKKSGKTALAAIGMLYVIIVLAGRFGEGYAVANDFDQAAGRVFAACCRIVEASPRLAGEAVITAKRITFTALGSFIEAIPSDYAGAAGSNAHIVTFDELWGYVSERSQRLWDEMTPPPTRKITCRLTVSYAGYSGESVLLEKLVERGCQGRSVGTDLYAQPGMLAYVTHACRAPWQTEAWLTEMRRTLRPNAYLRLIENRFVTTENSFIPLEWWDACIDPTLRPLVTSKLLPVTVGVDASVKHDSTAIVAVTWDQAAQKVRLVWHRIFQPTPDRPINFEASIEATLLELHRRFTLKKILFDPYQMQATAQRLSHHGLPLEEYTQSSAKLTEASENLYQLIKGRNLVAYADTELHLAVSRAIAIETPRGWRIGKDKQVHKIDVVVALAMAAVAAVQTQSSYDVSMKWVGFGISDDTAPAMTASVDWRAVLGQLG